MTVNVTQTDIENGCITNCYLCPVARAVRRAIRGRTRVNVDTREVTLGRLGHGGRIYKLPKMARTFIDKFDMGLPVRPITFKLTTTIN